MMPAGVYEAMRAPADFGSSFVTLTGFVLVVVGFVGLCWWYR